MYSLRKVAKTSPATPVPQKETGIAIELNQGEIAKKAFELNGEHRSYDDYIWMLAESETKLSKAILTDMKAHGTTVKVDASRIVEKPAEKDIRARAADLASKRPKMQDVHWLIAERRHILDSARGQK
jgi:hypothetical protein